MRYLFLLSLLLASVYDARSKLCKELRIADPSVLLRLPLEALNDKLNVLLLHILEVQTLE